jgi:hypothetical protein
MRRRPDYAQMMEFFPGQHIVARDGATYVLLCWSEGLWWAQRAGAGLPRPVEPMYPCWGGDDSRAGADCAASPRRLPRGARRPRREPPRVA